MNGDKVPVYISKELYEAAKKKMQEVGDFKSVDEFIEFILKEVLSEEGEEGAYTPEEEEEVRERLRSLGYI